MKTFKNESAFTRWFCDLIESHNGVTIAFVGSTRQGSSLPDRYICHKDFRGWIEFKKDKGKLSVGQRLLLTGLKARGDTCGVVRYLSWENWVIFETIDGTELATIYTPDFTAELALFNLRKFIQ